MIEKYVFKLSTFNLANKPTPTFKSSVLYISNHCINQRNHAYAHYFQKSQISLTMEYKVKHKTINEERMKLQTSGTLG